MKKILLLGGSRYLIPVINEIHKLGYYAITCDYLPDNAAHKYSDEYHNVSIIEKDAVLELARNLKVDGIMSFACDPGVVTAAYVAEKIGLPTNPYQSVQILQNKILFRRFLTEHGFQVPKARGYQSLQAAQRDIGEFQWPVIVKPADSAGSKGVMRIDTPDQLAEAAAYAISCSKTKSFIVEEFIEKAGFSSDSDCFSVNGKFEFISFSNQHFDTNAKNPYAPSAYTWPSTIETEKQEELKRELQRLATLLHLGTSVYNVEVREATNGKAYIMEMTPRGGGNRLSEMLYYATGVNLIENAVRASVGDELTEISMPQYNGYWAEAILHGNKDGIFRELQISEDVEKSFLVEKDLWIEPSAEIHKFTGANEAIGTLVLRFDSDEQRSHYMDNIDSFVKIVID